MMHRVRRRSTWPPPARVRRAALRLLAVILVGAPIWTVAGPAAAMPMVQQAQPAAQSSFTLHAQVSGLYPNATVTAPVHVDNPASQVLRVISAHVTIADASATCTAANLSAQPYSGAVRIPAHGAGAVPITLHLAASAPDTCQGATFPLTLRATGELLDSDVTSASPRTMAFTGGSDALALAMIAVTLLVIGVACWVLTRERSAEHSRS